MNKSNTTDTLIRIGLKVLWAWIKQKIFNKPPNFDVGGSLDDRKRKALLFAINNYPDGVNDLRGCINDQNNVISKLRELYAGQFDIKKFKNREVTKSRFLTELADAVVSMDKRDILLVHYSGHGTQVPDQDGDESDYYDEALYLYDGYVTDDEINSILKLIPTKAIVVVAFDSCHSGTSTRNPEYKVPRFHSLNGGPVRTKVRRRIIPQDIRWVAFSGCKANQVSYDAHIDGDFCGAFTYYFLKSLKYGITYEEWYERISKELPNSDYDQEPQFEGDPNLTDRIVFR